MFSFLAFLDPQGELADHHFYLKEKKVKRESSYQNWKRSSGLPVTKVHRSLSCSLGTWMHWGP